MRRAEHEGTRCPRTEAVAEAGRRGNCIAARCTHGPRGYSKRNLRHNLIKVGRAEILISMVRLLACLGGSLPSWNDCAR